MNPVDQRFREALQGRSAAVPEGLWGRIQAARPPLGGEEGEGVDRLFSDQLKGATAAVPADLWQRVNAARPPVETAVDRTFAEALAHRTPAVPAGLWPRIWAARTGAHHRPLGYGVAAALLLLFLGGLAYWLTAEATGLPNAGLAAGDKLTAPAAGPNAAASTAGDPAAATAEVLTRTIIAADGTPTEEVIAYVPDELPLRPRRSVRPAPVTDRPVVTDEKAPPAPAAALVVEEPSAIQGATRSLVRPVPRLTAATPPATSSRLAVPQPELTELRRPRAIDARPFGAAPRHRLRLELLFGAAYADQQLTTSDPALLPLRESRALSEYADLSYQVTLRAAYRFNDRWAFRPGLTYGEIRNQLEYGLLVNGVAVDVSTINQIRLFEAPLLMSYQIDGRRLHVGLNTGPVMNLTTAVRGRFLDPQSGGTRDLAEFGNYRRNTGLGWMGSITTTYRLGKKEPFLLVLEPFFKAYPTAFTVREAGLREQYWMAGLQLGVRKGF